MLRSEMVLQVQKALVLPIMMRSVWIRISISRKRRIMPVAFLAVSVMVVMWILRAAVKPTPSIAKTQQTVNRDKEPIAIEIGGRHDPIIVPRAVVVVEAMTAITVFDMMMESMSSNLDRIKRFFS